MTRDAAPGDWQPDYPQRIKALRELYASLPKIKCRGLCHKACRTRIDMSLVERARIETVIGEELPEWMSTEHGLSCPLLQPDKRCGVYQIRPMVCRLWGLAVNDSALSCHHGCEPERRLTDVEVFDLQMRSYEIGGQPVGEFDVAEIRGMIDDPDLAPLLSRFLAGDWSVAPDIQAVIAKHQPAPGRVPPNG